MKLGEHLQTLINTIQNNNALVGELSVLQALQGEVDSEAEMPALLASAVAKLMATWKSRTILVATIQTQFQVLMAVPGMLDHLVRDPALVEQLANAIYPVPAIFNALEASVKTSLYLAYLFSAERTEAELTLGRKVEEVLHDSMTLVGEITSRYAEKLTTLKEQLEPTELERKRVKRVVEFMQQLSYEQRQELSATKPVPLFMLHAQVESYQHQMQRDAASRRLKAFFKEPKKQQKAEFLKLLGEDFASLGSKVSVEEAGSIAAPLLWTIFSSVTKADIDNVTRENVSAWLRETILHGDGTAQALTWLPKDYIENVFHAKATNITLEEIDTEVLRGEAGVAEGKGAGVDDVAAKRKSIFAEGIALPFLAKQAQGGENDPALTVQNREKIEARASETGYEEFPSNSDKRRSGRSFATVKGAVWAVPGLSGWGGSAKDAEPTDSKAGATVLGNMFGGTKK